MLLTIFHIPLGPDAIQDHKTKILNARATGIGTLSPEGTGDLDYVLRAARVYTFFDNLILL
jgi:hypothetical protein